MPKLEHDILPQASPLARFRFRRLRIADAPVFAQCARRARSLRQDSARSVTGKSRAGRIPAQLAAIWPSGSRKAGGSEFEPVAEAVAGLKEIGFARRSPP
jgi:hypothetical protein